MNQLVADTVQYGGDLGFSGGRFSPGLFSQAVFVSVKVGAFLFYSSIEYNCLCDEGKQQLLTSTCVHGYNCV